MGGGGEGEAGRQQASGGARQRVRSTAPVEWLGGRGRRACQPQLRSERRSYLAGGGPSACCCPSATHTHHRSHHHTPTTTTLPPPQAEDEIEAA
jgi:hypothetical protein